MKQSMQVKTTAQFLNFQASLNYSLRFPMKTSEWSINFSSVTGHLSSVWYLRAQEIPYAFMHILGSVPKCCPLEQFETWSEKQHASFTVDDQC